jgi:hypothetical protein
VNSGKIKTNARQARGTLDSLFRKSAISIRSKTEVFCHSTLSTTADIYTSVDEEQVAETAEALGKVFCGRSMVETHCVSNSVN